MKKLITLLCLILVSGLASGQEPDSVILDEWLCCNLHKSLQKISLKHKVKFEYDENRLFDMNHEGTYHGVPLSKFLEQICKKYKLKYYIDKESGVIHVVDRYAQGGEELRKTKKTWHGDPTKFNFSLSGRVLDKSSQEPLPYVTLQIKGNRQGAITNIDGYFSILDVPTDTSTILVSYLGYQRTEVFLDPKMSINGILVEMEPEMLSLNEIVVTGKKQNIIEVSSNQTSMIKMSPIKLNTIPNLGEKDVLRSFQLMPGVSAVNENSSGLYVRGGTPDQVLVQYDGFTVYNVEHMFGFFSAFNSNAIKDVQLFKGGFDSKYGGRLSGVVEITGKEGNKKEFNAAADISMMSVNGFIEFPLAKNASIIVAGRRSWDSPLYNKIFDQFTEEQESSPVGRFGRGGTSSQETKSYFYDLNAKVTWYPSPKDIVALSFYNGKDDLDNSFSPGEQFNSRFGGSFEIDTETIDITNWGNTGSSLKWSRQAGSRLYINSLLSYSSFFSMKERSRTGSIMGAGGTDMVNSNMNENNNLLDLSAKVDMEYKLNDFNTLGFGVHFTHNNIDYDYTQSDTIQVVQTNSNGDTWSAYLQDVIKLFHNKVELKPGLRYNYFTPTAKRYYEPRINMLYHLTDKIKLKAAAGNYYQFAKRIVREDVTQGSSDFWVLSDNNNLPVSNSIQYIAGMAWENKDFLIDVEAFYKQLNNVTEYSLRIERQDGALGYEENFFTGDGIAKGIDILAQKKFGQTTGWIGYTLSQVTNNIEEFGAYDYYASHDVRHEFKFVLSQKWRNFIFGATWIYASGKAYTAPEGGYQLTLLDGSVQDYINVSVKNGNRLPAYHRLDLSATVNFHIAGSPANLGFSVFNIYNRSNVWYNQYEIIENEVIETPVYFLGITPNVNLNIKLK